MNGIEKNHSRVVAVFLDELESLMVIGSIGVVCQVLDFIQVFFVERIGKRFPIIVKSCFAGRLAFFQGLEYGGIISVFVSPYGGEFAGVQLLLKTPCCSGPLPVK